MPDYIYRSVEWTLKFFSGATDMFAAHPVYAIGAVVALQTIIFVRLHAR